MVCTLPATLHEIRVLIVRKKRSSSLLQKSWIGMEQSRNEVTLEA
jgi:hypothetical protein